MRPRLDWPEELPEHTREALQAFFDLDISDADRDTIMLFIARRVTDLLRTVGESNRYGLDTLASECGRVAQTMVALGALVKPERVLTIRLEPTQAAAKEGA